MSSSSKEQSTKISITTKLNDDGVKNNYAEFVWKMTLDLEHLDYWKYIEGPESVVLVVPTLADDKSNQTAVDAALVEKEKWMKGDREARRTIAAAIPAIKTSVARHARTARELWEILRAEYRPVNSLRAQTLLQELNKLRCPEGKSVDDWLATMRLMYADLVDQDENAMSDQTFARVLVGALPVTDNWRSFTRTIKEDMGRANERGQPMSSSLVIQRIKEDDYLQYGSDRIAETYGLNGLKRKEPPDGPGTVIGAASASAEKRPRMMKMCSNPYCKRQRGHTKEECFAYGGGKVGQYPETWLGRRDLHYHPNDPKARGNVKPSPAASGDLTAHAALAQEGSIVVLQTGTEDIHCDNAAITPSDAPRDLNRFYHDSGANRHIAFDRSLFHDYIEIPPLLVNGFDKSLQTSAVGSGTLVLTAKANGITRTLRLENALHVPSARLNLISQGCLERKGISCRTNAGSMTLSAHGHDLLTGRLGINNLFLLDIQPILVDLRSRISGPVEVLAAFSNWRSPDFGMASWGI